ncbi:hypothetical protein DFH29DRAFT_1015649, partial [Suillus ampliporus]
MCVMPVPDNYSSEVPLAFVVLHALTANHVGKDLCEANKVKASIMKVQLFHVSMIGSQADVIIQHVADKKVAYKCLVGGV